MKFFSINPVVLLFFQAFFLYGSDQIWDIELPPKDNYSIAAFRLWLPEGVTTFKKILVLVPGLNGDGRGAVNDLQWQAFAKKQEMALVAVSMKNETGTGYYVAEAGTGEILLKAIKLLGDQSQHPELDDALLLFWGHSAGGQFNYNFVCWKPDRVLAYVVNKGAYYDGKMTAAARKVPGIIFMGMKDTELRVKSLTSLFDENRKRGAFWCFAPEPGKGHELGGTKELAISFFESVLPLRMGEEPKPIPLNPEEGWLGNNETGEFSSNSSYSGAKTEASWLPDERFAQLWKTFIGK